MIKSNKVLDKVSIRLTELCATVRKYESKQEKNTTRLIEL